ncbi:MAG: YIP1 family protein [Butyrivibrio sp.]|nr:YIP1 family protein [Acetatifactor muris]MCM1558254.1 YIP1 family protein [Butyrivibrio sp.]
MKAQIKEKLYYLKYSFFHPFDAFYEMRFRGKGSLLIAVLSIVLFGILQCVRYQYTGFVMNFTQIAAMNSLSVFATWIAGFVLFIVSNWSVTTLLNGKGGLGDITQVIGYSLVPVEMATIVQIILSNFVIREEVMIVNVISGIGIVWFLFMIVAGLCTIHEYSFGKNIASVFLSFVAAVIIIFLGVLFFTLIEKMITFIVDVAQEFIRRM